MLPGMIRNLRKREPVVTAFALITVEQNIYIYGDRCIVRLCLLEQPGQEMGTSGVRTLWV